MSSRIAPITSSNEALATCRAVGAHGSRASHDSGGLSVIEADDREGRCTYEAAGERHSGDTGVVFAGEVTARLGSTT